MIRIRRGNGRKVAKLVRVLAALDEQARLSRPAPKRPTRASISA